MYQLLNDSNIIQRISDGAFIPKEPKNLDYQLYLKWIAQGNSPLPPS